MLKHNYINKEDNENAFQVAQENKDYNKMWECVHTACYNICLNIYRERGFYRDTGVYHNIFRYSNQEIDELEDVVINAAMIVIRDIKEKNRKVNKLSSYCYLRCLAAINNNNRYEERDKKILETAEKFSNLYSEETNLDDFAEVLI